MAKRKHGRLVPSSAKATVAFGSGLALALGAAANSRGAPMPASGETASGVPASLLALTQPPSAATTRGDPFGEFQASLLQQFPDSYGGMYQNADLSYTVVTVGTDVALQSTARSLFDQIPAQFGVEVPSGWALHFVTGSTSLNQLYSIMNQIAAKSAMATSGGPSVGVYGAGIDAKANQVVAISDTASPQNITVDSLKSQYGAAVRLGVFSAPTVADRTNDTPPWNGSDQIVNVPDTEGCTAGFGVHAPATGAHFNLTAGHCENNTWYNTSYSSPTKNSSTLMGSTYNGHISKQGVDTQLIADSSSPLIWGGILGQGYRIQMAGLADPLSSGYVCTEGSFSGEGCASIIVGPATESVEGETITDSFIVAAPGALGDSGGPVYSPTLVGPIAAGMIWAITPHQNTYFEGIDAVLYTESAYLNTGLTVNTEANP